MPPCYLYCLVTGPLYCHKEMSFMQPVSVATTLSRRVKVMPGRIAACIVLSTIALSSPAHADVSGRASVIDGDTIEVNGHRIRLHGIDAPESAQTCLAGGERWRCGRHATRALRDRIASRTVACEERDRGRYGRMVAVCRLGGRDLNAWMVSEGWALAYRRYSTEYVTEEASAKVARRGSGAATSLHHGTGGQASACSRQVGTPGTISAGTLYDAASRETSAATAHASTMFPAAATTNTRGSVRQEASVGSVQRPRPGRQAGVGRNVDGPKFL